LRMRRPNPSWYSRQGRRAPDSPSPPACQPSSSPPLPPPPRIGQNFTLKHFRQLEISWKKLSFNKNFAYISRSLSFIEKLFSQRTVRYARISLHCPFMPTKIIEFRERKLKIIAEIVSRKGHDQPTDTPHSLLIATMSWPLTNIPSHLL
jgi:hypothetical protein